MTTRMRASAGRRGKVFDRINKINRFLAWRTGEAGGRLGLPPDPAEGGPKLSCISCSTCLKNNPVNPVNPVKKEIRKELIHEG